MKMTPAATIAGIAPKRMIWVTFTVKGFHCYPKAPAGREYLRDRHRHRFGFRVWMEVWGDDRELEFHNEEGWLEGCFQQGGPLEAEGKSCEMLANELFALIAQQPRYDRRDIWIEVDEDGQCGCFMRYERRT